MSRDDLPCAEPGDRRVEIFRDVADRKVRLAARLRRETALSLKWLAEPLDMGSWTHVSNLLRAKRKRESLNSEK